MTLCPPDKQAPRGLVNKAVFGHSQSYTFKYCLWLCSTAVESRSWDEESCFGKAKMFMI